MHLISSILTHKYISAVIGMHTIHLLITKTQLLSFCIIDLILQNCSKWCKTSWNFRIHEHFGANEIIYDYSISAHTI